MRRNDRRRRPENRSRFELPDLFRCLERLPIPETNVLEVLAVVGKIQGFECTFQLETRAVRFDPGQTFPRPFDIVFDVRRLTIEFVWLNDEALNVTWNKHDADRIGDNWQRKRNE